MHVREEINIQNQQTSSKAHTGAKSQVKSTQNQETEARLPVVAEHPRKNVTTGRKASPSGWGNFQNSSEIRWTWLQNNQKEDT